MVSRRQTLLYLEGREAGVPMNVMARSLDATPRSQLIIQSRFALGYPEFSPDGRWLAFVSRESGRDEVHVQPNPGPGPRRQISSDGGDSPAFSRNGHEPFYLRQRERRRQMMSVPVSLGSAVEAGARKMLFEGMYGIQALTRGYDVSADGQLFYLTREDERAPIRPNQMVLVGELGGQVAEIVRAASQLVKRDGSTAYRSDQIAVSNFHSDQRTCAARL